MSPFQNGNAYDEGLNEGWNPIQKCWNEPTPENRDAVCEFLKTEASKSQLPLRRQGCDAGGVSNTRCCRS
jgi:hypothetical protein